MVLWADDRAPRLLPAGPIAGRNAGDDRLLEALRARDAEAGVTVDLSLPEREGPTSAKELTHGWPVGGLSGA